MMNDVNEISKTLSGELLKQKEGVDDIEENIENGKEKVMAAAEELNQLLERQSG